MGEKGSYRGKEEEMAFCMLVVFVIVTVMCNFKTGNLAKPLITLGLAYFLWKVGSRPFEVKIGYSEEDGRLSRLFYNLSVLLILCFWAEFIDRQGNNEPKDPKEVKETEEKKKAKEKEGEDGKQSDKRTPQGAGQDKASEGYDGG